MSKPLPRFRDEGFCRQRLPELLHLERLIRESQPLLGVDRLAELPCGDQRLPLYALSLGGSAPELPVVAFIGGVHGVERIGTQVLLTFLETLLQRLRWDEGLAQELTRVRVLFCPLLNPVGMARGWRCNGEGVDLMRNAPLDAEERPSWLVGGHRLGGWLPWYRGTASGPMETESRVLCDWIETLLPDAPFTLVLDCHSGFGIRDRLWFPYAGSRRPFGHLAEMWRLKELFDRTYPHHTYVIEPQCRHYTAHGDLWDYLYRRSQRGPASRDFLPLTLELGSWQWVKKSPWQQASFSGLFNPQVTHRRQRALRRHTLLLEFLLRAARSHRAWLPRQAQERQELDQSARTFWYEHH